MSDTMQIGTIVEGKVTGIQPYGAFVALDENTQGLVHISEITHGYVKNINEHIKVGEEVKVKVLSVDKEAGKIGLSMRAIEEVPSQGESDRTKKPRKRAAAAIVSVQNEEELSQGFNTLKEKLQEWIDQSQDGNLF
jgi:general stress protein 13